MTETGQGLLAKMTQVCYLGFGVFSTPSLQLARRRLLPKERTPLLR